MSLISGNDLVVRAVAVPKDQLVFVRHILEASEGLGIVVAERGGETLLVGPRCQAPALDRLIQDLSEEVGLRVQGSLSASDFSSTDDLSSEDRYALEQRERDA